MAQPSDQLVPGPDYPQDIVPSENVARDLVAYIRSNTIRNEAQFLEMNYSVATAFLENPKHFNSFVAIGSSSGGKTHVYDKLKNLLVHLELYEATSGTDKAMIYDDEWDDSDVVLMDELQKPSQAIIEFLKSTHGGDSYFEYKTTEGSVKDGFSAKTIKREAKPYGFLYAGWDADFEMWNRLLKIPIHESESKNRAVGEMAFQIESIGLDGDVEYGYGFRDGMEALQRHYARMRANAPAHVELPTTEHGYDWNVWSVMEPIFNHSRSEVNRIYWMVANMICGSAVLHFDERDQTTIEYEGEDVEAVVAEAQDVANVLACRDALLATTHEIDRKKRAVAEAIDEQGGKSSEVAGLEPIIEYLRGTDAPVVKEAELRNILEDLKANYLVDIVEDGARGDKDVFRFKGWDKLGFARVDEYAEQFEDCIDPITGRPFLEVHRERQTELMSAQDMLNQGTDDDNPSASNTRDTVTDDGDVGLNSFGDDEDQELELEPHQELVLEMLHDAVDGERVDGLDSVPVEALIGLVPHNNPDATVDRDGTILDPDHEIWERTDGTESLITQRSDTRNAVTNAITELTEQGLVEFSQVHTTNDAGEVTDATISVTE
jgi:hypothetical protein